MLTPHPAHWTPNRSQKAKTEAAPKKEDGADAAADAAAPASAEGAAAPAKAEAEVPKAEEPFVVKEGTIVKLDGLGKDTTRELLRVRTRRCVLGALHGTYRHMLMTLSTRALVAHHTGGVPGTWHRRVCGLLQGQRVWLCALCREQRGGRRGQADRGRDRDWWRQADAERPGRCVR